MTKFLKYFCILCCVLQLKAQKGDVTIGASIGVPHLQKSIVKIATKTEIFRSAFNGTLEISKIRGMNPVSVRGMYAITDHFELGVSMCTWNMGFSIKDYYNVQQAGGILGQDEIDTYDFKITSTSFGIRPNYIHEINDAGSLFYIGASLGYTSNNLQIGFASTDIGKTFPNLKYNLSLPGGFYFAPTMGIRLYFVKSVAWNLELGYEKGAILQTGLTVKFKAVKKK